MSKRPRIAYLTPNSPFPCNRGGRIRAHHLWRALSVFGDVTPLVIGDTPPQDFLNLMRFAQARFFPRRRYSPGDLTKAIETNGRLATPGLWEVLSEPELPDEIRARLSGVEALVRHCLNPARIERLLNVLRGLRPDLIVLCDSSIGILAPHVRTFGAPVVVGPHNFDSALYASMSASAPNEHLRLWNAEASSAFRAAETLFAPHVDQLWVCSRDDANRFSESSVPRSRIRIVPNVYDVGPPSLAPADSRDLVFIGQANYYPNEDAIRRLFVVSRKLDEKGVAHRMRIVGRIGEHLRKLAMASPSVEIVGEVESVAPYMEAAAIAPIALTLGGGTRLKILEAMSMARPVLSTPIGIEGIECENGVHAVIEPDLAAFPDRILELLSNSDRARRIALAGWELVRDNYSHEALLRQVGDALRDLGLNDAGPSAAALARNLGAHVVEETAKFNVFTRLLTWNLLVRLAANDAAISAEFSVEGMEAISNASIKVVSRKPGLIALEASAILAKDLSPEDLTITLGAWGREILRCKTPASLSHETAGLVAIDASERQIRVIGWSTEAQPRFSPEPEQELQTRPVSLRDVRVVAATYRDLNENLTISNALGEGQTFSDVNRWIGPKNPTSARLRQFKDKHAGETAWLIGNGPSVRTTDLDLLKNRLTFCFNRFHLAHDSTALRAAYTLTADKQMIEDFGQSIVDDSGGTVFIAHSAAPDLLGDYIWLRQEPIFPPLFSLDPGYGVSPGGSTPFVAIQLAYYMGVRKFYFYGADFSFQFKSGGPGKDAFRQASGEGNHFIANYRSGRPWCPPSFLDIGAGFLNARLMLEAEGGFIRNVTRGGALEIFEREDFDRAIASS
jgi:glycosyltransferase involved in cell wall biosynthesis